MLPLGCECNAVQTFTGLSPWYLRISPMYRPALGFVKLWPATFRMCANLPVTKYWTVSELSTFVLRRTSWYFIKQKQNTLLIWDEINFICSCLVICIETMAYSTVQMLHQTVYRCYLQIYMYKLSFLINWFYQMKWIAWITLLMKQSLKHLQYKWTCSIEFNCNLQLHQSLWLICFSAYFVVRLYRN